MGSMVMNGQAPGWEWARSAGGANHGDVGKNIAVDANGNSYITGNFESPFLTFGNITLVNADTTGFFQPDFFIAKYDSSGNVIWAKSAGGIKYDVGTGIAVDINGNSYAVGFFAGNAITLGSTTLTNVHPDGFYQDIFIVKYDPSGNMIWAKQIGGFSQDFSSGITADVNGNSYITGYTYGDTLIAGNDTLLNIGGSPAVFIIKLDALGNVVWARGAQGTVANTGTSVKSYVNGDVLFIGNFSSDSISFDSITLLNQNTGNSNIFIVKYDSSGNVIFSKTAGGNGSPSCTGIAIDTSGNLFITGNFNSDSLSFDTITLTNPYGGFFIVKYNTLGSAIWALVEGNGNGVTFSKGIGVDASENSYITGSFYSDTLYIGSIALINNGYPDILIAKFDDLENLLWAKNEGNIKIEEANSIALDINQNAYITGTFYGPTLNFGSIILSNPWNGSFATAEIFVAKFGSSIPTNINSDNNFANQVNIFPNPGKGEFNITSQTKIDEIKISNLLGQVIYHTQPNQKNVALQMDRAGVYFVSLTSNNQTVTQKLIVAH